MDEYVCLTLLSHPGETRADFSARLSRFWTHLLRTQPEDFLKVYAETTGFAQEAEHCSRQYLVEDAIVDRLEQEFTAASLAYLPIDRDDLFSKYEATPPGWMQIQH